MIIRRATIYYMGYDPDKLKPKSNKRICVSCDSCGRVRWIRKSDYRDLCLSCAKLGDKNPFYGKTHNDESKEKNRKSHLGENNSNYGKRGIGTSNFGHKHTQSQKDKWSKDRSGEGNNMYGRRGGNAPFRGIGDKNGNWKGGYDTKRPWVLPENQCIKINEKFLNSHFHHITKSVGIYIPSKLHRHIKPHSLKTGLNMDIINLLSLQYLRGWL